MIIENKVFDEERSLYNLKDSKVLNCKFEGEKDGESVLKEARNIEVDSCSFSLRYPLWHVEGFKLTNSKLDELTRAPLWYSRDGIIENCSIHSIKAIRECENISVRNVDIDSEGFGWKSNNIKIDDSTINSEYMLLDSKNVEINNLNFTGKYSFQYMNNLTIKDSYLDTKDAFWHSENVVCINSTLKGEYLAWFSKNLTLINCKIIGTQPLCYCSGLKMENCTMIDCDLSFEYSECDCQINGYVTSIKNPSKGKITVDSVGEVILDNSVYENNCIIDIKNK